MDDIKAAVHKGKIEGIVVAIELHLNKCDDDVVPYVVKCYENTSKCKTINHIQIFTGYAQKKAQLSEYRSAYVMSLIAATLCNTIRAYVLFNQTPCKFMFTAYLTYDAIMRRYKGDKSTYREDLIEQGVRVCGNVYCVQDGVSKFKKCSACGYLFCSEACQEECWRSQHDGCPCMVALRDRKKRRNITQQLAERMAMETNKKISEHNASRDSEVRGAHFKPS